MKKLTICALLSIFLIPGCAKRKIEPKKDIIVTDKSSKKDNQVSTEDAEEFVLEDDNGFNSFDDKKITNQEEDDFTWAEIEEKLPENKEEVVQFEYNSSKIKPVEEEKINRNVKRIKQELSKNDKAKVVVKGHSCKIAKNKEYNYALSQERASKVADKYQKKGIQAKPVGYGATMLLTDEDGMQAQAKNRRAETGLISQ